ncbi:MAG TPA: hypothetical protein VFS52_04975 [Steroidobacteraceae bacterium]|jgi:hypothetical protein|nr:hypothetical protein [Steroidobacteraceae bacterium]
MLRTRGLKRVLAAVVLAASSTVAGADSSNTDDLAQQVAALKAANEQLRSLIPSQSHAMMDVAYHFTNLWFAGQRRNWPLAQFYFNEARNHILWAIRLVPVRKTSGGELHLQEVFDAFDRGLLADLKKQIAAQNRAQFSAAYRAALGGCNACHTAAEKPYLHIVVPDKPEAHIVDFEP